MIYFFLVCHKPLGSSLQKCVEYSFGKSISEIINIDISPDLTLLQIYECIDKAWNECGNPGEIFIFSDIKGASPCNGLFLWLKERKIKYRGVTGVNLPMLVSAVNHKTEPLDALLNKVLEAKEKGIEPLKIYANEM